MLTNKTTEQVLAIIAAVLSAPRGRGGKLEFYTDEARAAREELRLLAVELNIGGAADMIDQCAKVAHKFLGVPVAPFNPAKPFSMKDRTPKYQTRAQEDAIVRALRNNGKGVRS